MLRTFMLLAGLSLSLPALAGSASYNGASNELTISEIGISGQSDRYRDVGVRLVS